MGTSAEGVQKLKTIARNTISLETPITQDGEWVLGDLLEQRWAGFPVDVIIECGVQEETAGLLRTLSPNEEKIIRARFGIGCDREHRLWEIARQFGLTRERIRQIEAKALSKLRRKEQARPLPC